MTQKIATFSMGVASDICMLKESKLKIQSVCTDEKCQLASAMLKQGYQSKKHLPFLDLVDHNLLIMLTIQVEEKDWEFPFYPRRTELPSRG